MTGGMSVVATPRVLQFCSPIKNNFKCFVRMWYNTYIVMLGHFNLSYSNVYLHRQLSNLPDHTTSTPIFMCGSCCSIIRFLCSILCHIVFHFILFTLTIALSVLRRFRVRVMVFSAAFNNISVISRRVDFTYRFWLPLWYLQTLLIGGGTPSTRRTPPTCHKLATFMT